MYKQDWKKTQHSEKKATAADAHLPSHTGGMYGIVEFNVTRDTFRKG